MMKLFLEGSRGLGKTTMILAGLLKCNKKSAGFVSTRLVDEDGETVGFYLAKLSHVRATSLFYKDESIDKKRIFLQGPKEGRKVCFEAFSDVVGLMEGFEKADFIVMDEIGGLEVMVPEFREFIESILKTDIPCIGTIKSLPNRDNMKKHIDKKLDDKAIFAFRHRLLVDYGVEIMEVVGQDKIIAEKAVEDFFKNL